MGYKDLSIRQWRGMLELYLGGCSNSVYDLKRKWCMQNGMTHMHYTSYCLACEEAKTRARRNGEDIGNPCHRCPVKWVDEQDDVILSAHKDYWCYRDGSPYKKLTWSMNNQCNNRQAVIDNIKAVIEKLETWEE